MRTIPHITAHNKHSPQRACNIDSDASVTADKRAVHFSATRRDATATATATALRAARLQSAAAASASASATQPSALLHAVVLRFALHSAHSLTTTNTTTALHTALRHQIVSNRLVSSHLISCPSPLLSSPPPSPLRRTASATSARRLLAAPRDSLLFAALLHSTASYSTVLYSIVQYCICAVVRSLPLLLSVRLRV